jgi:uncharacterized protein (DUF924 family)
VSEIDSTPTQARQVLDFWFGEPGSSDYGTFRDLWFQKRDETDLEVARRFGSLIERALRGELQSWGEHAQSALAQIVLLDQFTRNSFRGTPRSFAGDSRALHAATTMVGLRQDEELSEVQRVFVYMPFEHAESLALQDESLRLFTRLVGSNADTQDLVKYARRHRDVIERFGRFPHRNEILGRQSTPQELAYLREPGSRF